MTISERIDVEFSNSVFKHSDSRELQNTPNFYVDMSNASIDLDIQTIYTPYKLHFNKSRKQTGLFLIALNCSSGSHNKIGYNTLGSTRLKLF